MADDPSPDEFDEAAKPKPSVPKPPRDPIVIDGHATDVSEPVEPPEPAGAEPEPMAALEPEAAAPEPEAPEPEPARPEFEPVAAAAPPPPPPPPPKAATFAWGLSGVVIGAAVALGAAWIFASPGSSLASMTARQDAIEKRDSDLDSATKAIAERLAAQEAAAPTFAKADALTAIDRRLTKLETASAKSGAPAAGADATDKEAAQREAAAVASLDKRLTKLEGAMVPPGAVADAAAAARAAGDAAAKALALAGEKAAPPPAPDPRVAKLVADAASLSDRIAKLETIQAAPKAETRIPVAEPPPKDTSAAQAIAAIALEQRLRSGEPFGPEFAALSSLGGDAGKLAALKPFADAGAPTASALAASFSAVAPAILDAAHPRSDAGGPWDKLLDHVNGLVKVRRVNEVPGDDPDAVVSRISAELDRGQVGPAVADYARLPEACRKAGGDWGEKARARVAADAAARGLREAAIANLAAAKK